MLIKLLFMALVGGVIGWITNVLAIKMLFRPLQPVKVPIFNIYIQGLIPKRRNEIARSIAGTVENELINIQEIIGQFTTEERKAALLVALKDKILNIIDKKMPSYIPSLIKGKIVDFLKGQIEAEGKGMLEEAIEYLTCEATNSICIKEMVESKINQFELEKIEQITLSIAKNELKHIELLGGVLGVIIGLVQGLVLLALS